VPRDSDGESDENEVPGDDGESDADGESDGDGDEDEGSDEDEGTAAFTGHIVWADRLG
jgi:hypothetical protein